MRPLARGPVVERERAARRPGPLPRGGDDIEGVVLDGERHPDGAGLFGGAQEVLDGVEARELRLLGQVLQVGRVPAGEQEVPERPLLAQEGHEGQGRRLNHEPLEAS